MNGPANLSSAIPTSVTATTAPPQSKTNNVVLRNTIMDENFYFFKRPIKKGTGNLNAGKDDFVIRLERFEEMYKKIGDVESYLSIPYIRPILKIMGFDDTWVKEIYNRTDDYIRLIQGFKVKSKRRRIGRNIDHAKVVLEFPYHLDNITVKEYASLIAAYKSF